MTSKPLLGAVCAIMILPGIAAAENLTVMLDWFVNPDHGPLFVAREKGYFEQAGLDVELIAPADPNNPPKFVAAGKADIAISYQPQLHVQVAQGLPLVRIGTLVSTPLNSLVVNSTSSSTASGPMSSIISMAVSPSWAMTIS